MTQRFSIHVTTALRITQTLTNLVRQRAKRVAKPQTRRILTAFSLYLPLVAWPQSATNSDEVTQEIFAGLEAVASEYNVAIPWNTLAAKCLSAAGATPPNATPNSNELALSQDVWSVLLGKLNPELPENALQSISKAVVANQGRSTRFKLVSSALADLRSKLTDAEYRKTPALCLSAVATQLNPRARYIDRRDYLERPAGPASIGVRLMAAPQGALVKSVFVGSSAEQSDIHVGDLLTHIDSNDLSGLSLERILNKLRGPQDSKVQLTLQRPGQLPRNLTIVRKIVEDLPLASTIEPGVALIKVWDFGERTTKNTCDVLAKFQSESGAGLRAIIFDLRDNTGGLLAETVALSKAFLPINALILETRGRTPQFNYRYIASSGKSSDTTDNSSCKRLALDSNTTPVALLVGKTTAVGAEAFAAALQDHQRAVVIGERTAGIANSDQIRPISPNGMMQFTVSYLYRPSGAALHGIGVLPDVAIAPALTVSELGTEANKDRALQEALRLIRLR